MIESFIGIGFHHILSPDALDHILFLAALAACYRPKDWRHGLTVISAFTVGHTLTLALTTLTPLRPPTALVEFLIPLTVVIAALDNLRTRGALPSGWRRPLLAGAFGLIHGAGFSTTLRGLFDDGIITPLLGFNIGIELGQVVVLASLVMLYVGLDRVAGARGRDGWQLRVRLTSLVVASVALVMALERAPWA
ncbi:MAG TPA: HupE/UreJ family protein [Gemmatimonadales bacterium]|nr:HupE/UreJ family protein [Gemmatimonadales bacterium]